MQMNRLNIIHILPVGIAPHRYQRLRPRNRQPRRARSKRVVVFEEFPKFVRSSADIQQKIVGNVCNDAQTKNAGGLVKQGHAPVAQ